MILQPKKFSFGLKNSTVKADLFPVTVLQSRIVVALYCQDLERLPKLARYSGSTDLAPHELELKILSMLLGNACYPKDPV